MRAKANTNLLIYSYFHPLQNAWWENMPELKNSDLLWPIIWAVYLEKHPRIPKKDYKLSSTRSSSKTVLKYMQYLSMWFGYGRNKRTQNFAHITHHAEVKCLFDASFFFVVSFLLLLWVFSYFVSFLFYCEFFLFFC